MNDFKVGDPVEYVGSNLKIKQLGALTVTKVKGGGTVEVNDQGWTAVYYPNLRHITPAPDVLTIPRSELPEVVVKGDWVTFEETGHYVCGIRASAAVAAPTLRRQALELLAAIDYLEAREKEADAAREKAEQDAAEEADLRLCQRRDELAEELTSEQILYSDCGAAIATAIDRIIQLEGQAKK